MGRKSEKNKSSQKRNFHRHRMSRHFKEKPFIHVTVSHC